MKAASSHGPVDAKRYAELSDLFSTDQAGLVFASCFPSGSAVRDSAAMELPTGRHTRTGSQSRQR